MEIFIKNISPAIVNLLIFDEVTKLQGRDLVFNPFFKAPPATLSFVTYTMVANVPNGVNNFKFKLTNPLNEVIHETSLNAVEVKDNAFYNVMIWNNVHFSMLGEHTITFYLSTDDGFEPTGSNIIIIDNPPQA
ncbi:MAG: hypothetical protein N3B21_15520 [Clostridia bacterium]|nr:hypothetical protein [Clostridia bacterium]